MDFTPILEDIAGSQVVRHEVIILVRGGRHSNQLRAVIEANLPPSHIKFTTQPAQLIPSDAEFPAELYIIEFGALKSPNPDLFRRLKAIAPDCWVIIVAENSDISSAFDVLEGCVDDILQAGAHLPRALRESLTHGISRNAKAAIVRGFHHLNGIPLLAVADHLLDALILVDSEGLIIFANAAWRQDFPSPTEGRLYLADLVHPNDLHRLEAELQLAIIENTSGKALFRSRTSLGDWATIQATISGMEVDGHRTACLCGRNITLHHQTQLRLGDTERNLKLLETLAGDVVYRIDGWSKNLVYTSANFLSLTGYTPSELSLDPDLVWSKLLHSEYQKLRKSTIDTLIKRGPSTSMQSIVYPLTRRDGSSCWIEEKISLEWSRDGEHHWINGNLSDVTTLHDAQSALESSQADHKRAFNELLEGFAELDLITSPDAPPDFRIDSCNSTFEHLTGLSFEKLSRSNLGDLFPGLSETPVSIDDGRSLAAVLADTAIIGKSANLVDFYWPHLRSYFQITAVRIKPGHVALNIIDITLQRQAELRLETVLRGLPDTALYQTGGGIEYISPGIENLIGYTPEEITQNRNFFTSLIHPDDRSGLGELQKKWMQQGSEGVLEMEFRVRRRDGEYIWILDRMSRAFTAPDGRQSSQGVMIDITARKNVEAEIRRKSAEFDLFFKAIPDLYFRLTHDGIILDWRAGSPKDLYVPPEEFLGKRMQDVLPKQVGADFERAVEQLFQEGKASEFEYILEMPSGPEAFEARFFELPQRQMATMVRNITAQRHQADLTQRRLRRLQTLNELSIKLNRLTHTSQICDAVAEQLLSDETGDPVMFYFGDEQNLALARVWSNRHIVSEWVSQPLKTEEIPSLSQAFESHRPVSIEGRNAGVFGSLPPIEDSPESHALFPLTYRGKTQGVLCICKPDREGFRHGELEELAPIAHLFAEALSRAEAVEALEQSNSFLTTIFEQSPVASWVADASGVIISVNPALRTLFHIPEGNRFPVSLSIFDNEIYQQAGVMDQVRCVFDEGVRVTLSPIEYDLERISRYAATDPEKIVVSTTLLPVKDARGKVIYVIAQINDYTAERALQGELQRRGRKVTRKR